MEKKLIERLNGCTNDGIWIYNANGNIIAAASCPETRDLNEAMAKFIADAINEKIERHGKLYIEMKDGYFHISHDQMNRVMVEHKPIELKNLKNPE